jgi:hypothetical protein
MKGDRRIRRGLCRIKRIFADFSETSQIVAARRRRAFDGKNFTLKKLMKVWHAK